ncbi:MAG: ATP-dependent Clp protease ATP-binding subunit [Rubrobacteraceae bacterium]
MDTAHEVVRGGRSNLLGTEHVLFALLAQQDGAVRRVFLELDLNLGMAETKVKDAIRRLELSRPVSAEDRVYPTQRTKQAMTLAVEEAQRLNEDEVGPEHLLLGLLRLGEGAAFGVLKTVNFTEEDTRRFLEQAGGGLGELSANPDSMLAKHTINLTELARDGKLDSVVGRDGEIRRLIQILGRRTKNTPVLIGEPGVGKTSIAEGLAQKIVDGRVPEFLKDRYILALDMGSLMAGAKFRGDFEERLRATLNEVKNSDGRFILFIDDLHNVARMGSAGGGMAGDILKPALARGNVRVIGATTIDEYRKLIEPDAALERRFQCISVEEPSEPDTVRILRGLRDRYEQHHGVEITDEALEAASSLAHRYIADRFLPDKAVDLLDEAASQVRIDATMPDEPEADGDLNGNPDGNGKADGRVARRGKAAVNREEIARVVSAWTGIPVTRMLKDEAERLLSMEGALHRRVIGQEPAVDAVSEAVRRARAGLAAPNRPIGSFIFLGPTGVGKTELARALAEYLFDDEDAMIRLDMSEYMEAHAVSRLVGSPPGYVGYDEGGQLTEAVRRRPYSVLLLDEIEKAHSDVFNMLLQILEDGRLTDNKGRTASFDNAVIIMTSNVGAELIPGSREMLGSYEKIHGRLVQKLHAFFRPEFLNRVDEVIVFHALGEEELVQISDLLLERVRHLAAGQGIALEFSMAVKRRISREGEDSIFGARPLRRAIQKWIESPLSKEIISSRFGPGATIHVDVNSLGHITFEHTDQASRRPAPSRST